MLFHRAFKIENGKSTSLVLCVVACYAQDVLVFHEIENLLEVLLDSIFCSAVGGLGNY